MNTVFTIRNLYKKLDRRTKDNIFYYTLDLCSEDMLVKIWNYSCDIALMRGESGEK